MQPITVYLPRARWLYRLQMGAGGLYLATAFYFSYEDPFDIGRILQIAMAGLLLAMGSAGVLSNRQPGGEDNYFRLDERGLRIKRLLGSTEEFNWSAISSVTLVGSGLVVVENGRRRRLPLRDIDQSTPARAELGRILMEFCTANAVAFETETGGKAPSHSGLQSEEDA